MASDTRWIVQVKTDLWFETEEAAEEAAEEIEQDGIEESDAFTFGYLDWETRIHKVSRISQKEAK